MFYSDDFRLTKQGGMGIIWLAATLGPKSRRGPTKRQILACDVSETCDMIKDPIEPMALRTTAGLLVGVVRVYDHKIEMFHKDVEHFETTVRKASLDFNVNTVNLDLASGGRARIDQITMTTVDGLGGLDLALDAHDWQNFLQDLHGNDVVGSRERSVEIGMDGKHECRNKHVADAKDINLPVPRGRINSMGDWSTSPFHDYEKMDVDDRQEGQVEEEFDLGLDIGMDMPIRREKQTNGSLLGSLGKQGGGFSSSVGGYGGMEIEVEDMEPLDLGLDIGMDFDQNNREASITASEQARQDLEVGQDEIRQRQGQGLKRNLDALLQEGSHHSALSPSIMNELKENDKLDIDMPPPNGNNVDEGIAGLGQVKRRRKGLVTDKRIELDDATMQEHKSGYTALMQRLTIEQIHKEQQTKYNNNAISGLKALPMDKAFKAPAMIAFWAEATHRVYGNKDRVEADKGQPEEYIAKLGGREGRMDDRQEVFNDYEMEFGNDEMEQGGGRVRNDVRGMTQDLNDVEYGRRASGGGGSQKSQMYPWDRVDLIAPSEVGEGGFADGGFASSNGGTGARFSIGTPQEVKLRNRRARSNSLLLSNQGSALRAGSTVPADLGAQLDDQNYEMPVDEIMADFEGTGYGTGGVGGKAGWMDSQEMLVDLDTETQKFLTYIKNKPAGDPFIADDDLLFDDIAPVESSQGNVAAQAFYHCLSLATKDIIKLTQDEHYSTIRVKFKMNI